MSELEKNSIDCSTRSKTPLPQNLKQNVSDSIVNSRKDALFNRPAPASKKRKIKQAAHVKELLKLCKPLSINLNRLSQQEVTKVIKKREHHVVRHNKRNRWQKGFADKKKKPKSDNKSGEKSSETQKTSNSIHTHIYGCCRMIPFDRNKSKNHRKLIANKNKDLSSVKNTKIESTNDPTPSTSKTTEVEKKPDLEKKEEEGGEEKDEEKDKSAKNTDSVQETSLKPSNESIDEDCVCRRTIPYIRKTSYKLNFQTDEAGGSKNSMSDEQKRVNLLEKEKKNLEMVSRSKPEEMKSEVGDSYKKTEKINAPEPNELQKNDLDDSMEENLPWLNNSMWKMKRKHRIRRISSSESSSDEMPKKKSKIEHKSSGCLRQKEKSQTHVRTLCPPSCTNREHHSEFFKFLYKKPRPAREARVILKKLEDMQNDPDVVRWNNRRIKEEMMDEEEETTSESQEEFHNQRYYLLNNDGTMSNEAIPQEALYQIGQFNLQDSTDFERINSYQEQVIDVSKFFNNCLPQEEIMETNNHVDHRDEVFKHVEAAFHNCPRVLLIRLETLVGALDSEYSASEIEILEEKYIDFLLNSNFSYDKQSQTFFNVYKRLHAKREKEKQLRIINGLSEASEDDEIDAEVTMINAEEANEVDDEESENVEETNENDESDSNDDNDDNPLVIALENEKINTIVNDWASDESEVTSVTPAVVKKSIPTRRAGPKVSRKKVPPESSMIEFIKCDLSEKSESEKEPLFISCKFCKTSFKSLHSFTLHKNSCHLKNKNKNKRPLKCTFCNTSFKCNRNLKLHVQHVHGNGDAVEFSTVAKSKTSVENSPSVKTPPGPKSATAKNNANLVRKKIIPAARQNLRCGVCAITFESKESLWDHVYQHTEQELQTAFNEATARKLEEEMRNAPQTVSTDNSPKGKQKQQTESTTESKEWANKYAQWKDSILYKNDEASSSVNQNEEITLCSSESDKEKENIESLSSTSRSSVIKNTNSAERSTAVVTKTVTMCPCHSNDTTTMMEGDMQIEMVLLCEICQVLFRRLDCFEVHYRVNRLCNKDRSSRLPKLFCSCCKILLNSLPEMRRHLEKHAEVNRRGHVTFLCNICKVMFFGIGTLFYSHWFNHNKDVNFLASRYSFPKLSIVPGMNLIDKSGNDPNRKDEYLFVAEHVCKICKIPFGSETELESHPCSLKPAEPEKPPEPEKQIPIKFFCLACKKTFPTKNVYILHENTVNHMRSTKPEFVTISTITGQKAFICAQCKGVRFSLKEMKEHWIFHRPWREKFFCSNCITVCSSKAEEVEEHCKGCDKTPQSRCNVSFILATFKCPPCNLYFETANEWKEHNQVCLRLNFSSNTESNRPSLSPSNSTANPPAKPPVLRLTVPSSALTTLAMKAKGPNAFELMSVNRTQDTPVVVTKSSSTVVEVTSVPSNLNSNSTPVLTNVSITAPTSLEKLPQTDSDSQSKSKEKRQSSIDVEVIDIVSESSSRSSGSDLLKRLRSPNSTDVPKDMPLIESESDKAKYDLYTFNKLQSDYRRKDISLSKAVICYPPKKADNKNKKDPNTLPTISNPPKPPSNVTMTTVNPEFESLLTALEGLDKGDKNQTQRNDKSQPEKSNQVPQENKDSEETIEKIPSNENSRDSLRTNEELPSSDVGSVCSVGKDTNSPLPFEVVLLPDEDDNASSKTSVIVGNSTPQVDINSNKAAVVAGSENIQNVSNIINKPAAGELNSKNKDSQFDPSTASVIEEYIEFIMMDVTTSNNSTTQEKTTTAEESTAEPAKETTPPVEKEAPKRLRVRTLAELQEIKMHLCDVCGQSFDCESTFSQHVKGNNCCKTNQKSFLQPPKHPSRGPSVSYETSFTQKSLASPNQEFLPPLMPLAHQHVNAVNSIAPGSPIISGQRRQSSIPFGNQNLNQNSGMIHPSNSSYNSHVPRSGTIHLPERTGGSAAQKRPSGAATRIQNVSNSPRLPSPGVIHHRGLPHSFMQRAPVRLNQPVGVSRPPPPPYIPNVPYRPQPEKNNTLTWYQEMDKNNPNTSGYRNSPVTASDIYGTSSVTGGPAEAVGGAGARGAGNWQSPAKYIYACRLCSFQTENKATIRLHEKNHMAMSMQEKNQFQNSFPAQQQLQGMSTFPQTIDQQETTAANKQTDKNSIPLFANVSNDVYKCLLCDNFFFTLQEEFTRHLQTVHKRTHKENFRQPVPDNGTVCFVCDYCDPPQVFNSEKNLRKHMNFLHNHICHICSQRCTSREILQTHVMSHKLDSQTQ